MKRPSPRLIGDVTAAPTTFYSQAQPCRRKRRGVKPPRGAGLSGRCLGLLPPGTQGDPTRWGPGSVACAPWRRDPRRQCRRGEEPPGPPGSIWPSARQVRVDRAAEREAGFQHHDSFKSRGNSAGNAAARRPARREPEGPARGKRVPRRASLRAGEAVQSQEEDGVGCGSWKASPI